MTEEINIAGMVCVGHTKAAWLPNLTYHPRVTVADFSAPGAMNVSFHMFDGFGLVFDDGRWSVKGCLYVTDPQNPDEGLSGLLQPGESGYFAFRYGPTVTTDWADGQIVNVVPCVLGPRNVVPSSDDGYALWAYRQEVFVSGKPIFGAEVAMAQAVAA